MATKEELDKLKEALEKVNSFEVEFDDKPSIGIIAQEIEEFPGLESQELPALTTLDLSSLSSLWNMPSGNITISTGATGSSGSILTSAGANGASWSNYGNSGPYTISSAGFNPKSSLEVSGDANFEGDIKWRGRSLGDMLETIESRLAILVPDPEKLEHFEALQKAYEHYKTLEALCTMPTKDDTEH